MKSPFARLLLLFLLIASRSGFGSSFDMSHWLPEEDGSVSLEGPVDMYWGKFYTPEDFATGRVKEAPLAFKIPGVWNKAEVGGLTLKANHYASYRWKIVLPEAIVKSRSPLTLEVPNMPGAYRMWINGELVIKYGTVGRNAKREKAALGKELYTFVPDKRELDVVLQLSSFHHRDGGTWWPLRLGLADHMSRVRAAGVGLDGFAMSALFIMAFYHFGLWLMRREYKAPLVFALFCCIIAMRASVTGLGDLHKLILPDMPHGLQKLMEYAGFYLGVPAYYSFVRELYPQDLKVWMHRVLWLIAGCFSATTLFLPAQRFTDFIEYFQIITLVAIVLLGIQLIPTIRHKRDGIGLLLLGSVILVFSSFNDILHAHRSAPIPTMIFPYGLFFMILCQAILLARRFSQAFHEVEVNEKQIQSLNAELKNQNAVLDQLVEEKTRDIRSIMKNIKQGIFTVLGDTTRIGGEFSDHLRSMLGMPELKGGEPYESLFEHADLSRDRRSQISTVLSNAAGEDSIAFDVNSHLLPREMQLSRGRDLRTMEVDWIAIENENTGTTDKILVSLRDVTDLRKLQEESRRNQEELQLIGEVLNVPADKFDGVLHSCEKFVHDSLDQLSHPVIDAHRLFRNMHTIKGIARSYGWNQLADAAHDCEETYAHLRDGKNVTRDLLLESGQRVGSMLQRYDRLNREKLGRKKVDSSMIMVDRALMARTMEMLKRMDINDLGHEAAQQLGHLSQFFMETIYMPLPKLLEGLIQGLPQLAADLGKETPELVIRDPGLSIQHEAYDLFRNTFTHLLRNAVDHGLERSEDRRRRGKAARGRIVIDLRLGGGFLEIFVGDDGRGLDLPAIMRTAQQRGLIASDASLSDYEVANLIFAAGLSTREQVTSVSGRGVGLDAVKNFIDQFGGEIEIQLGQKPPNVAGMPFRFHITLPASVCEQIQAVGQGVEDAAS